MPNPCSLCNAPSDDLHEIAGASYCPDCRWTCDHCRQILPNDADSQGDDNITLCLPCYNEHYFRCDNCDSITSRYDSACTGPNDATLCESCGDECSDCESCGARFWNRELDENNLCTSCRREPEPEPMPATTFKQNPFGRKVGLELEFIHPDGSRPRLSDYGSLKGDGSVHPTSDAPGCGLEFASNPASGDSLLALIESVCKELKAKNCEVNHTCGFHVHLDMAATDPSERLNTLAWWQALEPIFYGMVPWQRRDTRQAYRRGYYSQPTAGLSVRDLEAGTRYRSLNIRAWEVHNTYEVRLHQGTTNAWKVKNWVLLLLHFFDTFGKLDATPKRLAEVVKMTDRGKLIFLFQQCRLPLSLRKYIVSRVKDFAKDQVWLNLSEAKNFKRGPWPDAAPDPPRPTPVNPTSPGTPTIPSVQWNVWPTTTSTSPTM